uniref:Septin-7 n=1 Tax=Colobus angolensis palliatus TaxID=336983 RepID=A0A2K5JEE6_COLAP
LMPAGLELLSSNHLPASASQSAGGEPGLGKSTLINSLLLTHLYSPEYPGPSHIIKKNVQLLLTIVDTPGLGDALDNSNCWQLVIDYIDSKCRIANEQTSVGAVLLTAPSGHGLKPLVIELMKRMHEKVIIIPLIAKADTLTPEECQQFKKQIMKENQEHKMKIYEFPETDDEEENKLVKKVKDRLPLAVVGSNTIIEVNGKRGVAEVENGEHCDFTILRNMLIRTHTQNLKDVTNNVHYKRYRSRKLAAVTYNGVNNNKNKGQLTKTELQGRHEQMKKKEAQHKELEEKRCQFEDEKANWEAQQRISEQQNSLRTLEKNNKKGKIF